MKSSKSLRYISMGLTALMASCLSLAGWAQSTPLPAATSPEFCIAVQHILANTKVKATNTVFEDMAEYRHSKPSPDPLMIYQVVTYDGQMPIAVACKVKAADHIRAAYGNNAAGEQRYCPEITELLKTQAITELEQEAPGDAVARARAIVIDQNEPYVTGQSYLSTFELSYVGADGKIHLNTPALQVNWDDWLYWIMPNRVRGQTYCHLATVPYIKALAAGTIKPGTQITSADEAPTKPAR